MTSEISGPPEAAPERSGRFLELDELQREIAARLKDNQRFLEGFLADDYDDDVDEGKDEENDDEEL